MKIYILRHEDRTKDCTFFSPLTKKGLENSNELIPLLEGENINVIYSSPFIRTLQTIHPYSKKHNIKINLEYGLSEFHLTDLIPKQSVGVELPDYLQEFYNYNPSYQTIIKEIKYPETLKDVKERTVKVFKNILENHIKTNDNIIIVSHLTTCIYLAKTASKNKDIDDYPKGQLSLIYDHDWNYKTIK